MFRWLISLLSRRRRLKSRNLLRYWDGRRWRYGDPFRIWRQLQGHPKCNIETMAPLAEVGQEPETTIVVEAIAEVFGVPRWNDATGEGLTDLECLDLLSGLVEWFDGLKKNYSRGLTSLPPTD
jgi:hypothetical protein